MQALRTAWRKSKFDKPFFWIVVTLVIVGMFVFASAALSVLAKNPPQFYRMLLSQLVLGLVGGVVVGYVAFRIPFTLWRKLALYIFIASLLATLLVFIPGLSVSHGGATRWIALGPISFQPAEFLKIGFVMYMASWYAWAHKRVEEVKYGIVPLVVMLLLAGGVLLAQPDTGTFLVIAGTALVMYFIAGARMKDLAILMLMACAAGGVLLAVRPYTLDRVKTFLNPARDPQGASYQVRQAFIAVGSGKVFGRGYGQSVQKHDYLPEPTGDSVFAVAAEEVGFIGAMVIIILYLAFAYRGLFIARRSPSMFSRLLVIGLVSIVMIQSFLNIASVIGVFPMTGLPLIFMSHGGTALMFSLISMAMILHVSQYMKRLTVEERVEKY